MSILISQQAGVMNQVQLIMLIFAIGVGLATAAIYLMIFLFGMSVSIDFKKTAMSLLLLFILPILVIGSMFKTNPYTNAQKKIAVYQLISEPIGEGYAVAFITKEYTVAYLEYKDNKTKKTRPIMPENDLKPTNYHEFLFQPSKEGGEITFIIDGEVFMLNDKPIKINPR